MKTLRLAVATALLTGTLLATGCADGRDGPTAPAMRAPAASQQVEASGAFDALVDFSTLTLTPRGRNCLLEVEGRLVFTGTIDGTAVGRTSALVFAPCDQVATTPPGTFRDVFRSELEFAGTVDGEPATAQVLYTGGVAPGGTIDARLIFSNGVSGVLDADAVVAVGGTYAGSVVVH